jgi:hypothetical protein
MYSTQRLYFHENPFLAVFQNFRYYVVGMFDILQKGIEAAKVAENDPTDREALLRILSDD